MRITKKHKAKSKSKGKDLLPLSAAKQRISDVIKQFFKTSRVSQTDAYSGSAGRYKGTRAVSKNALSNSVSPRRYNPKKRPLWKDKKIIAGACAFAVVITVVLSVSIPGEGNNIYASNVNAAYSPDISPAPSISEMTGMPQPSGTASSGISEAELALLQQSGYDWVSSDLTGSSEEIASTPAPAETEFPNIIPSIPSTTPLPTVEPEVHELVPGCNDPKIVEVQERLMELGYMEDDETTDYYGWGTEYSLQLFQRKHSLQIDGLIGDETMTKLFSEDAMPYTVKLGDRGTDVESLQDRLKELKYLKTSSSGYFGTDTEKAVKNFQKRNGLSADGTVGEITKEALFSEDAKPAAKPSSSSSSSGGSGNTGSSGGSGNTGSSGGSGNVEVGDPDQASVDKLIEIAESLLGSKYVGGGKGPNTFDCSGFVYYCLNKAGYRIGYMTSTAWATSNLPKISSMDDLKAGDIICFSPHHVGIYIGDGQMIDASSGNGKVVKRSCTTSYWKSHFRNARRVF